MPENSTPVKAGLVQNVGEFCGIDEKIFMMYVNTVTLTVQLTIRYIKLDGSVDFLIRQFVLDTSGTQQIVNVGSCNGWIQSGTVSVVSGTPTSSSSYFEVGILRGGLTYLFNTMLILKGYLSANASLSNGVFTNTVQNAPAPSSTFAQMNGTIGVVDQGGAFPYNSTAVTAGKVWIIDRIFIVAITSAVAGNRFLTIAEKLAAGGNTRQEVVCPVAQAASLTYRYEIFPGSVDSAAVIASATANYIKVCMPFNWFLAAAQVLTFGMDNAQAGDTFNQGRMIYREFNA